jgi:uncharacterized protein YdeI (YjbR/CyaY-like superfamily)
MITWSSMSQKLDRDDIHEIRAPDRETWRAWLQQHHAEQPGVWLLYWRKSSGRPSIDWSDAVDEAICFGWIDSTRRPLDDLSFKQYFAPRKPKSTWSRINKAKVERLIAEGRMTTAGLTAVEQAKANGSWEHLDDVEAMRVPDDLDGALDAVPAARRYFDALSRMKRWEVLYWVNAARREDTRADRIRQVVDAAAERRRPPRFRQ